MLRSRATPQLRLATAHLSRVSTARCAEPSAFSRSFYMSALSREVVKVPQMAESISEGTLKQWLKKKGDYVEVDEEVATIETDKIDVSVNAPSAGIITELFAEEEDTVAVGNDLFKLEAGEKPSGGAEKAKAEPKEEKTPEKKEEPKKDTSSSSSESNRKPPQEHEAVKQKEEEPQRKAPEATEARQPSPSASAKSSSSSSEKPATKGETTSGSGNRTERRVKMNSMRKRIAERLKQSQNTAASLTTFNEIDMSSLISLRSQYKDRVLKDKNVKFGYMGMFAKAVSQALKEFPAANAAIEGDGPGDQIVYRD